MLYKNKIKVIIYDCDGVLFNSKRANEAFYNHILTHFGLSKISKDQLEFVHTCTSEEAIDYLFGSLPQKEKAMAYLKVIDSRSFIPLISLEPHVKYVLEHIRQIYSLAIATNRGKSMSMLIKEFKLEGLFSLVVTSMDVEKPKPDPESLLKILKHFNVSSPEALFIGDSEVDLTVSNCLGVPFISYKNPNLEAIHCLYDHKDLLKILN